MVCHGAGYSYKEKTLCRFSEYVTEKQSFLLCWECQLCGVNIVITKGVFFFRFSRIFLLQILIPWSEFIDCAVDVGLKVLRYGVLLSLFFTYREWKWSGRPALFISLLVKFGNLPRKNWEWWCVLVSWDVFGWGSGVGFDSFEVGDCWDVWSFLCHYFPS